MDISDSSKGRIKLSSRPGLPKRFESEFGFINSFFSVLYVLGCLLLTRVIYFIPGVISYCFGRLGARALVARHQRLIVIAGCAMSFAVPLLCTIEWFSAWLKLVLAFVVMPFILTAWFVATSTISRSVRDLDTIQEIVRKRWPERAIAKHLRYPEDAFLVRIIIDNSFTLIPAWMLVILCDYSTISGILASIYFVMATDLVSSQETIDHINMHNHIFQSKRQSPVKSKIISKLLDIYMTWIINPLCLRIPHLYNTQHVYIHHVENNSLEDNQTTLLYDRSSFLDYCRASLKSAISFATGWDIVRYLLKRGRYRLTRRVLYGVAYWYGIILLIGLFNWQAALLILFLKLKRGLIITVNNFAWHGFIDLDDEDNIFKNTSNFKAPSGFAVYGGAFHIEHHLQPGLRWHKIEAMNTRDSYLFSLNNSIEILRADWFGYPLVRALWLKRHDFIVSDLLQIGGDLKPSTDIVHERTKSKFQRSISSTERRLDGVLGRFVARWLLI